MRESQAPDGRRTDWAARKRPAVLLPLLAVALVFASAVTQVTSPDTWVHLSLGRWMAENGRVPRANLLSYTQPERAVVDHQWLFQACLYGLWRVAGVGGATLVKAALVAATFGLVLATARRKGAGLFISCLVTLGAAFAARFRFTLRPDVVGLLLLSIYLHLLERWRHGRARSLLVLLPLQVAWANFHGSSVLGWGLALAYAAAETVRAIAAKRLSGVTPEPRGRCALAFLWVVALLLVPLTLANPNGVRVLELPFGLARAHAAPGLKELHEERAALSWDDLKGRHRMFAALAGLGILTLVGSVLRKDVTELGLFLGLLGAGMYSARFVGLFAVAAAPIVARNLSAIAGALASRGTAALARPGRAGLRVAGALAALAALAWLGFETTRGEAPLGLGPADGLFPQAEIEHVQAHWPTGNLFNEFEHGGYIYWQTRRPVFIDSRGLLAYEPAFYADYLAMWDWKDEPGRQRALDKWAEAARKYEIGAALVARPTLRAVLRSAGWQEHAGTACSVFVRSAGPGERGD